MKWTLWGNMLARMFWLKGCCCTIISVARPTVTLRLVPNLRRKTRDKSTVAGDEGAWINFCFAFSLILSCLTHVIKIIWKKCDLTSLIKTKAKACHSCHHTAVHCALRLTTDASKFEGDIKFSKFNTIRCFYKDCNYLSASTKFFKALRGSTWKIEIIITLIWCELNCMESVQLNFRVQKLKFNFMTLPYLSKLLLQHADLVFPQLCKWSAHKDLKQTEL